MKRIFEASNTLEAHMIKGMLESHGICARVSGDFLQGAVGELPAAGLAQVRVNEDDVAQAREILEQWHNTQPEPEPDTSPIVNGAYQGSKPVVIFFAGVMASAFLFLLLPGSSRSPGTLISKTSNNQGVSQSPPALNLDRNNDSRPDEVISYSNSGIIASKRSDLDFDGRFETNTLYLNGQPSEQRSDWDGDGNADQFREFQNGQVTRIRYLRNQGQSTLRIDRFQNGQPLDSSYDQDLDGVIDTVIRYDLLGLPISRVTVAN